MNHPHDAPPVESPNKGCTVDQSSGKLRTALAVAFERGLGLFEEGRYSEAVELLTRSVDEGEAGLGSKEPILASLLNVLGIIGKYRGDFGAAEGAYQRALEIVEADTSGKATVDAPTLLHNLAGLAHSRGEAKHAERLAVLGIQARVHAGNIDRLALAADKAALAPILVNLGKMAEAADLLTELIRLFEDEYGADHYEVAISAHNLGSLYLRQRRWEDARPHLNRALKIKQMQLGDDHPELAITLHNLATIHRETGDIDAATAYLSKSIAVLDGRVAPDHPTLTSCRTRLAELLT